MSRQQSQKYIRLELAHLNNIIDRKIIKGESYRKESLRHKMLTSRLRGMENDSIWSSFFRLLTK